MFGKRGVNVERDAGGSSEIDFLKQKVDALQQKLLTSEKLQSQIFDFMAGFERQVTDIIEKRPKEAGDAPSVKAELKAMIDDAKKLVDKPKGKVSAAAIDEAISAKLEDFDENISGRLRDALAKINVQVEGNKGAITELKASLKDMPGDPKQLRASLEEAKTVLSELQNSSRNDKPKDISKFEDEITSKLNKALDNMQREVESTSNKVSSLGTAVESIQLTKVSGGRIPGVEDLKSFKLTFEKKLQEMANEIDNLNADIATNDYVAILETEFRDKLEDVNSRLNAFEASDYTHGEAEPPTAMLTGLDGQRKEVAKLRQEFSELSKKTATADQIAPIKHSMDDITKRLDWVSKDLVSVAKSKPTDGTLRTDLNALKEEFGKLSKRALGQKSLEPIKDSIEELGKRVEWVSKDLVKAAGIKSRQGIDVGLKKEIDSLRVEISQICDNYAKGDQLRPLRKGIEELSSRVDFISHDLVKVASGKRGTDPAARAEIEGLREELSSLSTKFVRGEQFKQLNKGIDELSGRVELVSRDLINVARGRIIKATMDPAIRKDIENVKDDLSTISRKIAIWDQITPLKRGVDELSGRMETLSHDFASMTRKKAEAPSKKELEVLRQEVQGIAQSIPAISHIRRANDELSGKIELLTQEVAIMAKKKPEAPHKKEIEGLKQEVQGIAQSISSISQLKKGHDELSGKMELLSQELAAQALKKPEAPGKRELNGLKQELEELRQENLSKAPSNGREVTGLRKELESLKSELRGGLGKADTVKAELRGINEKVDSVYSAIDQLETGLKSVSKVKNEARGVKIEDHLAPINKKLSEFDASMEVLSQQVGSISQGKPIKVTAVSPAIKREMSQLKSDVAQVYANMDEFIGRAVKTEELEFVRRGLKEINRKVDTFSGCLDAFSKNIKGTPQPELKSSINTLGSSIEELKNRLDLSTQGLGKELDEFKLYTVEQLGKTSKWIEFINQNLK